MQIVIDIPDHIYNSVVETGKFGYYKFDTRKAIKNGVVLPKGHGRLIDESKITGTFTWDNGYIECFAPTIIEADKRATP